jgi:FSR family fosmidomycin resistance protein-like MFS transporter
LAPPLLLIFSLNHNLVVAVVMGLLIPFAINGMYSTLIVTGQNFLPNRIGTASGILLGLTISIGGMFSPAIGWIGDNYGLKNAMFLLTALSIPTLIFAFAIPKKKK